MSAEAWRAAFGRGKRRATIDNTEWRIVHFRYV